MKRIILFSTPTPTNIEKVLLQIFPEGLKDKILGYMPSDGNDIPQKYIDEWKCYSERFGAGFFLINNCATDSKEEQRKLLCSNILVISGGNTFKLLANLRKSELDKTIHEFVKRDNFILSGFSAGALVLTPTINICNLPNFDENLSGLTDFTGLGIVDFEVFPHYNEATQKDMLEIYRNTAKYEVKEISDEDFVVIDTV